MKKGAKSIYENANYYSSPVECIKSLYDTITATPKVRQISVLDRISSTLAEKVTLAVIGINKGKAITKAPDNGIKEFIIKEAFEKGVTR
jgi:hypothetical protein